jgi:hypothetical protein
MGANAEQMALIDASSIDHVSYILVLLSVACIVFLFANVLIYIYDRLSNAQPNNVTDYPDGHVAGDDRVVPVGEGEFELRGLMSDDDDDSTYDDDPDESKRMLDSGGSSFEGNRSSTSGR